MAPRRLELPTTSRVASALLEFLYAQALITPALRDVAVLCELLTLPHATLGEEAVEGLRDAVVDGLHAGLTDRNAAGVFEAATLAGALGLQLVALTRLAKFVN